MITNNFLYGTQHIQFTWLKVRLGFTGRHQSHAPGFWSFSCQSQAISVCYFFSHIQLLKLNFCFQYKTQSTDGTSCVEIDFFCPYEYGFLRESYPVPDRATLWNSRCTFCKKLLSRSSGDSRICVVLVNLFLQKQTKGTYL